MLSAVCISNPLLCNPVSAPVALAWCFWSRQVCSIIAFVFVYTATKGPPFDLIVLLFPQNIFLCLNFRLMTRDQFIPAKQLNLLAAGWIQFNLHDWFDHGPVDTSRRINIDLDMDDPVHKGKMKIPRTKQDNCPSHSVQRLLRACFVFFFSFSDV